MNIKGVATDFTGDDLKPRTQRTADVTAGTGADPHAVFDIDLPQRVGTDREFEIKLTADERLAGMTATTAGAGATILAASLSLVPLIAKVVPIMGVAPPATIDDAFEQYNAQLGGLRRQLKAAIDDLQQAVVAEVTQQPPDHLRLKALKSALALARAEAADVEAQFNAWRNETYPRTSRTLSYSLGTDELPRMSQAENQLSLDLAPYPAVVRKAAETLGILVVRIEEERRRVQAPDNRDDLHFRLPRQVTLAVYEAVPGPGQEFRLRSLAPASVIDSYSTWSSIAVRSDLFREHGVAADFGEEGTLLRLSNKDKSGLGAVASAVAGGGASADDGQ